MWQINQNSSSFKLVINFWKDCILVFLFPFLFYMCQRSIQGWAMLKASGNLIISDWLLGVNSAKFTLNHRHSTECLWSKFWYVTCLSSLFFLFVTERCSLSSSGSSFCRQAGGAFINWGTEGASKDSYSPRKTSTQEVLMLLFPSRSWE